MVTKYTKHYGANRRTPQTKAIPGREAEMVKNNAGGVVFILDDWSKLQRFLILGTEGGSFYASEAKMTVDNAKTIMKLIAADGPRVVAAIQAVSVNGRAYKQEPALYALALAFAHGDEHTKSAVRACFCDIVRIGTHLFTFIQYVQDMRGWGKALRALVQLWYDSRTPEQLAFQVSKYQQRNGMSHRDLVRLAHPKLADKASNAVLRWVVAGVEGLGPRTVTRYVKGEPVVKKYPGLKTYLPKHLLAVEQVRGAKGVDAVVELVSAHNLPREVLPTEMLNEVPVWNALLPGMPPTALIRNLGKLTSIGLISPMAKQTLDVVAKLTDEAALKKARVHPIQILAAFLTYKRGAGVRGSLSWTPVPAILDALDKAFYTSFENVETTGKRILYAVDVSGSMGSGELCGVPGLTPRVAATAMALVLAAREPAHHIMGFSSRFMPLNITPRMRLDQAIRNVSNLPFEGTDCALPMLWAMQNRVEADAFVVLTDNETWAGGVQPSQALKEYRKRFSIPARLAVIGMTATGFTIADPRDPGMMDFVGFSTDVPSVLGDFIQGLI